MRTTSTNLATLTTTGPKRLIVNADDFGMSRAITDSILLVHKSGVLTSASLMANMEAAEYALGCLAAAPGLEIGVHLNLCAGKPVLPASQVSSLVDANGKFHSAPIMARALWTCRARPNEIEKEFRAQTCWMKHRGVVPGHADSHHHMHMYPAAAGAFVRALAAEAISHARAPRCTAWPKPRSFGGPHGGSVARRVLVQGYRNALQSFVFHGLLMPDSRVCILASERRDSPALQRGWISTIENLPEGTFELVCHPGRHESGFSEEDSIHAQREAETDWLISSEWRDALSRNGIQLISHHDVEDGRTQPESSAAAVAP